MRLKRCAPLLGLACAGIVVLAQAIPRPPQNAAALPQQLATAKQTIKTQTRLITVDVVVTDSHGAPVRGLKKDDFHVLEEHNREQQIAQFQFIDRAANVPQPGLPPSATLFTNELSSDRGVAPTVLVMDSLNTESENQMQVRHQMLLLLKTLPPTTPVAIFSLTRTLHVIQTFSTDRKALSTALNKVITQVPIEKNPQDDAESASNQMLDFNGGQETEAARAFEDFETRTYEAQLAIRVDETTEAMIQIAKYLAGYAGRKNLVWFSESFPIWVEPSLDFSRDTFAGSAAYNGKVHAAAEALTDARIAVYPVDAKGLAVDQVYSTNENPHINRWNPGGGLGDQLGRQNTLRVNGAATMEDIAENTGGRTCKNTNDLSGCVQTALNDSSTYYALAYYPDGIAWDGRFHKITVKTDRHGARLAYRRGYLATDLGSVSSRRKPEELLKEACMNPLSSTAITLTVQPVASTPEQVTAIAAAGATARYLLSISPNALTFELEQGLRRVNLQMAICEFDPKENTFQLFSNDLSRPVPDDLYKNWQERGIRNVFDYDARPEDRRIRFVVLDVPSGEVGSVDVPAHPHEFADVPGVAIPALASAPAAPTPVKKTTEIMTEIVFRAGNAVSSLDWSGNTLSYHGAINVDQGAPAFFRSAYGAKFHCEAGKLVANDPGSGKTPSFLLTFQNPAGTGALVELGGDAPGYSGSLPVDGSARAFFDYLWKLCHCQQP